MDDSISQEKIQENMRLVQEYPFLLPHSRWTGEVDPEYDFSYTELDSLSNGWRVAFGDMMLQEIKEQLVKEGSLDTFRIDDLKEKWGRMELYFHGASDKVGKIIDKYSLLSEFICECCGKPGVRSTMGWISPMCFECWKTIHTYIDDDDAYKAYLEDTFDGPTKLPTKMRWNVYANGKHHKYTQNISKTAGAIRRAYKERRKNG